MVESNSAQNILQAATMTHTIFHSTPTPKGIPPTFKWPIQLFVYSTLTTYILSLVTGNFSQVDRVWTFLPTMYSAYYALLPLWPTTSPSSLITLIPVTPSDVDRRYLVEFNPRALLMFGLQFTWMIRLSYNTWRRGLFNFNEEDYRWVIFRQKMPKWVVHIFNLTFIAITQNALLFMISLPTHNALTQVHTHGSPRQLVTSDYILGGLSVLALLVEFTADNQQFAYQTFKKTGTRDPKVEWPGARINFTKADAQRGFITKGLWAWSRHPNFFCEQSFWVLQTLVPIFAKNHNLPITLRSFSLVALSPALALITLFISSTVFTESITAKKYPLPYNAYKRRVAMFIPILTPLYGVWTKFTGEGPLIDGLIWSDTEPEQDKDISAKDK